MRRCTLLLCIVALVVLAHPGGPAVAQSPAVAQVEVRAVANDGASVTVDFQAWDAAGQAVLNLDKSQVQVVEDGNPASVDNLQVYTSEQTPTLSLLLADSKPYTLTTTGATIGIVFDAAASGSTSLKKGREAIQQFLLLPSDYTQPRTKVSVGDKEFFSLFIPSSGAQQQFQPPGFEKFHDDPIRVWNYIDQHAPVKGPTPLNVALRRAVQITADGAQGRHSHAVVLVVSDGQDPISNDLFEDNLKLAQDKFVQLVIFGIGSEANLQRGWGSFDSLINRYTIPSYPNPNPDTVGSAFDTFAIPAPASLFRARYTTRLPLGLKHSLAVQVNRPDRQPILSAPPLSYDLSAPQPTRATPPVSATPGPAANNSTGTPAAVSTTPRPLSSILGAYFLLAGALAILAAILVVSAVGLVTSRSLDRVPTKH